MPRLSWGRSPVLVCSGDKRPLFPVHLARPRRAARELGLRLTPWWTACGFVCGAANLQISGQEKSLRVAHDVMQSHAARVLRAFCLLRRGSLPGARGGHEHASSIVPSSWIIRIFAVACHASAKGGRGLATRNSSALHNASLALAPTTCLNASCSSAIGFAHTSDAKLSQMRHTSGPTLKH